MGLELLTPTLSVDLLPTFIILFTTDPMTGKMVTDGSDDTDDLLNSPKRGIAFNDKHPGYFLTNQDLSAVFKNVRHNNKHFSADQPGGALKKLMLLAWMHAAWAIIEIATQLREHTNYIIFSQEVVLGAGWNYATTLKRLGDQTKPSLSPLACAKRCLHGMRENMSMSCQTIRSRSLTSFLAP